MTPGGKKRILFVCVGNACRSQMAEAFARAYGSDVIIAASAGIMPALNVASDTTRAMKEKNLDLRDHFPKHIKQLGRSYFDIVVNMTGGELAGAPGNKLIAWRVEDPIRMNYKKHCEVRDEIERLVMGLVLEVRRLNPGMPPNSEAARGA